LDEHFLGLFIGSYRAALYFKMKKRNWAREHVVSRQGGN
jgi:hypothetical protein